MLRYETLRYVTLRYENEAGLQFTVYRLQFFVIVGAPLRLVGTLCRIVGTSCRIVVTTGHVS